MNWMKQQLANVAGTQEPIYGPSAIRSVAEDAATTPTTELNKEDLRWKGMTSTCVETQTFYITADNGYVGMAQVIYSNVGGIRTTCQFNSKIFYPDEKTPHLWCSNPLDHHKFSDDKYSFHADKCDLVLSEDGTSYSIKSSTSTQCIVDITFSKVAPGFVAGKDGLTHFGTDLSHPWGSMRHAFWPRCKVQGSFMTKSGEVNMSGRGLFIHALQGMKPHHAAARWNFCNFQSPTYSAVMMEYTTPPSYGSTVVNVGGIAIDGKLVCGGSANKATHTKIQTDSDVDWPEPKEITFDWVGKNSLGQEVHADLSTPLAERTDRVDVMAEVPKFVKQIVANAAGTRPYIYQYINKPTLKIQENGEEREETGTMFMESTFIS